MDIGKMIKDTWDNMVNYQGQNAHCEFSKKIQIIEIALRSELQKIKHVNTKLIDGVEINVDKMIKVVFDNERETWFYARVDIGMDLIDLALKFNESELYKNEHYQSLIVMDKLLGE